MSITKTLPLFITLFIYLIPAQVNAQAQDFTLAANGVTVTCDAANVGDTGDVTINGQTITFTKRDRTGIDALLDANSNNPEVATTCTSDINNMSNLFNLERTFNQEIGSWDVSQVTDMSDIFFSATSFNKDISGWNVSQVTDMDRMFVNAANFNQNISGWDVGNVTTMSSMFNRAGAFNQDISGWDVSQVTSMDFMFSGAAAFNQDLSGWCVEQIASKPNSFDNESGFEGQTEKQPQWGTCPTSTSVEDLVDLPTEVQLQQNFPNPFNPSTTIQFALPESQQVSLVVYDMLGRRVAELLRKEIRSAGSHAITFDADGFSSGVYFYRLRATGGATITRKLTLIK